ncbi:MAG: hypothetical protein GY679_04325 [Mycoplasma sp.]|nr:hypothetical protein [Mycoplasma sp.]
MVDLITIWIRLIIMFSLIGSNLIFNIIEYFSFINLFLLFLFIIITLFFILINSTLLYYSNVNFNHCLIEFISTLFSLLFLIIIISPALIILLDFDLIILPSFIIYSLGLQWAWQFNIIFLPINIGFNSYCDHYIISTNQSLIIIRLLIINRMAAFGQTLIWKLKNNNGLIIKDNINKDFNKDKIIKLPFYLWDINTYILLPIYSFIRLFLYSFDVIHTLGFYSWGIKIDAIPGRINLATTLRLLWKGEYRGKCFELCGQGHLSMIMLSIILNYFIKRMRLIIY